MTLRSSIKNLIYIFVILFYTNKCFCYQPQKGQIALSLNAFIQRTDLNKQTSELKSPWYGGEGLLVNGALDEKQELEIGLLFTQKNFYSDTNDNVLSEKSDIVRITMGDRYWFENCCSISASIFSDYTFGEVQTQHIDQGVSADVKTSAHKNSMYGADLSFQFDLYRFETQASHLILDTRYSWFPSQKNNESINHYSISFNYKFLVQNSRSQNANNSIR